MGAIVHYVSYGTTGGEYPSACRAAIVTAVDTYQDGVDADGMHIGHVSLCVLNPEGQFFNRAVMQSEDEHRGGTWHWPKQATPETIEPARSQVRIENMTVKDMDPKKLADELAWLTHGWPRIQRQPPSVEYHWMITYLVPTVGGFNFRQKSGRCHPGSRTRSEMFEALAQQIMDEDGLTLADFSVVYFGMEPNSLDAA
jgi:hypothetical protein